ncbi:hypothetical protein M885DRAFT_625606 [Pelagophyceae sp. CCMP2097]|nr:hypothetical protein M885DRAFT_625606 [Pelagophyceae sp. CCMP2097]|mmetsp:Transcript_9084/g.30013  ORF Transcript_9084/g.30013 Transcript_9084/m.30013 type:complete len:135 (-) Transcript_9084:290-694(-)
MQTLFLAALLCPRPADAVTAPKAVPRRAIFTASAAAAAGATPAAFAAPSFLEGVPLEAPGGGGEERIGSMPAMNRAPNQPPSGPLAGTALGYRVGEAKVPFNEKIPARPPPGYVKDNANAAPTSFLDGVPRDAR